MKMVFKIFLFIMAAGSILASIGCFGTGEPGVGVFMLILGAFFVFTALFRDKIPHKETEKDRIRARIEENRREGIACCPKCGSVSLSANKKGYSFVKGVLVGPLGGTIGMNKIKVTCLNCGYKFKPGAKK